MRACLVAMLMVGCGTSSVNPMDAGADGPMMDATEAGCMPVTFSDTHAAERTACTFQTGATTGDTLGLDAKMRAALPIQHVIVVMKENRGFDHVLGKLHDIQPDVEAIPPSFVNLDKNGMMVSPSHATTTCFKTDPEHQWTAMHNQVNSGKMDGFVTSAADSTMTDGHFVLTYYDQTDLPFYYWMASTFAIGDRQFAPIRSGTYPNRNFILLGTADGVLQTGAGFPDPTTPTIFDLLDAAGVTWGVYTDGYPFEGTLNWKVSHVGVHKFAAFVAAVDAGTLPQVAFVDSVENVEDEHPPADVQRGEAWTRNLYQHVVTSSLWPSTAMIWTYDEAGGFFDHVPPPEMACVARPIPKDAPYYELGVRVPLVMISPWARPHFVSHVVRDHTAVTRLIEAIFDLPALTARDGNSDAMLDMFDFSSCTPPMSTPPTAPAAGIGGCN